MKLVEIVESPWVSSDQLANLKNWFQEKGKVAAICKDSPGFIVNRVARNFYGEALKIIGEDNQQRAQELDKSIRSVGGFKMGPFELMDLIGVDINYAVTLSVWNSFKKKPSLRASSVTKKACGRKTFWQKIR